MTCQQVQTNLSLYLYGELDFATEERVEQHLDQCAACQYALGREKSWHTALNSEHLDVPLDLLSKCRRDLRVAVSAEGASGKSHGSWLNWIRLFRFSATRWSTGMAVASFLVFIGFSAARWMDRAGFSSGVQGANEMGFLGPGTSRIRDIQAPDNQHVRIIVDHIREQEIAGRVEDQDVRRWLLAATKDPSDPGIRVDSVEMLRGQDGADVRDALLYSLRHDSNAAVRLKALEALRGSAGDPVVRDALRFVLERDSDPVIRSEAIDILAPVNGQIDVSSDLAGTLQHVVRSSPNDDYVRTRCLQLLEKMNASLDVY
jgi:hypothetical protein